MFAPFDIDEELRADVRSVVSEKERRTSLFVALGGPKVMVFCLLDSNQSHHGVQAVHGTRVFQHRAQEFQGRDEMAQSVKMVDPLDVFATYRDPCAMLSA